MLNLTVVCGFKSIFINRMVKWQQSLPRKQLVSLLQCQRPGYRKTTRNHQLVLEEAASIRDLTFIWDTASIRSFTVYHWWKTKEPTVSLIQPKKTRWPPAVHLTRRRLSHTPVYTARPQSLQSTAVSQAQQHKAQRLAVHPRRRRLICHPQMTSLGSITSYL